LKVSYAIVLKAVAAFLPSVIVIVLLVQQFPHTGSGRIAALSLIVFMNAVLIALCLFVTERLPLRYSLLVWPFILGVTLCVTVLMYPQEHRPSVASELWNQLRGSGLYSCSRSADTYKVYE
jgi:hypothetical protein